MSLPVLRLAIEGAHSFENLSMGGREVDEHFIRGGVDMRASDQPEECLLAFAR